MAGAFDTLSGIVGVDKINVGDLFDRFKLIFIILIVAILAAVFIYFLLRYRTKKDLGTEKEIRWWEDIHGNLVPTRMDTANEVTIPGTSLKLFHIKKTNTWLPRFTRGVTQSTFFVAITQNKEIINFTLKSIEKDMSEAGLKYDHTDMRWSSENLREFVKRNYRDKAVPWWREYQAVISTAIFIVIMTFSLGVIIYMMKGFVGEMSSVASAISDAVERLNVCSPGSGIIIDGGA